MSETLTNLLYLAAIVSFIVSLRFLSSPRRARLGTWVGAAGMALAIAVTLAHEGLENYGLIGAAIALGTGTTVILFVALLFGAINVVGGFVVTDRMLEMFKGKKKAEIEAGGEGS